MGVDATRKRGVDDTVLLIGPRPAAAVIPMHGRRLHHELTDAHLAQAGRR